jgi:arylformamidase
MVRYLDISVPTSPSTTVYPGDPVPKFSWPGWSHEKGDPANVGFFQGGLHHGTHVDAPWHFIKGAKRLHQIPLEHWVGECQVLDLTGESECVNAQALERADIRPGRRRLLFKTRNSATDYWHEPWNPNFIYIHPSAAAWCTARRLLVVGLDYLTIDSPKEPAFPAHLELLGHETVILENLNLREVPAGVYELLAAPVNLQGVDGAWCRALLRTDDRATKP